MFGTIKVLAGDFSKNDHHQYIDGTFLLETAPVSLGLGERIRIPVSEVVKFEIADKDNAENIADSIGWHMAGKAVTFTATFSDNRKIFASTDNQTYVKIKAAIWERNNITSPNNKNSDSGGFTTTRLPRKYEVVKPWSDYIPVVVILLVFIPPIGLWGLWRSKSISTNSKVFWTVTIILVIAFRIAYLCLTDKSGV